MRSTCHSCCHCQSLQHSHLCQIEPGPCQYTVYFVYKLRQSIKYIIYCMLRADATSDKNPDPSQALRWTSSVSKESEH